MDSQAVFAVVLASIVAVVYVVFAPLLGALVWFFAGPHPFGLRLTRQVR